MQSSCICSLKASFHPFIVYKNETVFKEYEGAVIGICNQCGMMKTIRTPQLFQTEKSRADFYENHEAEFSAIFNPLVGLISSFLKKGSIIDVGCATGVCIRMLKKKGYDVFGIEPNKDSFRKADIKFPKKICCGHLKYCFPGKVFNAVIYNHTLEHIPDPVSELKEASCRLQKGGILVVGVPNRKNAVYFLRRKYWESLLPSEHIWHFSTTDLVRLLEKSGFSIKKYNMTIIPDLTIRL